MVVMQRPSAGTVVLCVTIVIFVGTVLLAFVVS